MNMKIKNRHLLMASAAVFLAACGSPTAAESSSIAVISREQGSGTRSAFTELFGIEKDGTDQTKADGEVTNSTAVMMTTVDGNPAAIGYISLGSLNDQQKAVSIDGVLPSTETVKDGSYSIVRPFLIVEKEGANNELTEDFKTYILSADGQKIIEEAGYVPLDASESYTPAGYTGSITVGGSSSVTPVMEKLAEAYSSLNPDAQVSVLQTDSSTGATLTAEGTYDLGMSSRELKPEEVQKGLASTIIAQDGIAVIVNPENTVENLSKEQVRDIYTGAITAWDEVTQ